MTAIVVAEIMAISGLVTVNNIKYQYMRIFEIRVNGHMVCSAGLEGANVLTAILTSHVPNVSSRTKQLYLLEDEQPLDLNVAGTYLENGEIKQWPKILLAVGDEVCIAIKDEP